MGTIHAQFGAFKDVRAQVMANRGRPPLACKKDMLTCPLFLTPSLMDRSTNGTSCNSPAGALLQLAETSAYPSECWGQVSGQPNEGPLANSWVQ